MLPSGGDCTYMGVAPHPENRHRVFLSYYSGHQAPDDPDIDQWSHPDIYLVDALFSAPFIDRWRVSDVLPQRALADLPCPDPDQQDVGWSEMMSADENSPAYGFADATEHIAGRAGIINFVADIDVGSCEQAILHLGFDGPVKCWVNGTLVFTGAGTNPAIVDAHAVPVTFQPGANRIAMTLDTNGGRACGIFARYEAAMETRL